MLKGFKDFIMRGNVLELAIAVVIGSAFTNIVTSITKAIIEPLLAAIGSPNVAGFGIQLVKSKPATFIDFGAVITAAINFLIIAAVVYFIFVMPMNKFIEAQKRRKGIAEDEPDAEPNIVLLTEIRDLLKQDVTQGKNLDDVALNSGVVKGENVK